MPSSTDTLGDIAATSSRARSVLLRHRLDFCCGGTQTLGDACAREGISTEVVLRDLAAALTTDETSEDWSHRPITLLVDHILGRYHAPLPAHLDTVVAAAEKVERVHAAKESCPRGLASHLRQVRDELANHMAKEERVLFPAIQAGRRGAMLGAPVSVMVLEHEEHGRNLARIRELAHDLVPPPEACATWRTLYEELARLESELMAHIHLENHVLFPRALAGAPSPD